MATDTLALHDRADLLRFEAARLSACARLPAGRRRPAGHRRVRAARRLHRLCRAEPGSRRLRRLWPGLVPGRQRRHYAHRSDTHLHVRRAEGPRQPGRRHRRLPDGRGRCCNCAARPGPIRSKAPIGAWPVAWAAPAPRPSRTSWSGPPRFSRAGRYNPRMAARRSTKLPHDIDDMLRRIERRWRRYPKAAMFELAEQGYTTPFEQLVACIISIRTYDEVTLPAAQRLFAVARTPAAGGRADARPRSTRLIRPGHLPRAQGRPDPRRSRGVVVEIRRRAALRRDLMLSFPGVGPKCANLALGIACGEARHQRGHPRPPGDQPLGLCRAPRRPRRR